jgi:hypothetical protein
VGEVPLPFGLEVFRAAAIEGIEPAELGALLISEHNGSYPVDKSSPTGARGLLIDLDNPVVSIELGAAIVAYSQDRVEEKGCGHHWVAHYKCGRSGRDSCRPVARYERILREVEQW